MTPVSSDLLRKCNVLLIIYKGKDFLSNVSWLTHHAVLKFSVSHNFYFSKDVKASISGEGSESLVSRGKWLDNKRLKTSAD